MIDFSDRLLPNERVVWTGKPRGGLRLSKRDLFLIPFSVLWLGFVVFWESSVLRMGAQFFMVLWGGAFLVIGLFFMVGRFFIDAWLRRNLAYALTDQRLLILRGGMGATFTAVGRARLSEAQLTEQADRSGTIRIGPELPLFNRGMGFGGSFAIWVPALDPTPQLIGIPNVRGVFDQIQRLAATEVQ